MSAETIEITFFFLPALNSYLCAAMASYTIISLLDHQRWMKEWGSEHEAVPVLHLNRPILSSAITMGVGGITTVHQVGLPSVKLDGINRRCDLVLTILACATAVISFFGILGIAKKDVFADVDRVTQLKKIILDQYSIASIKKSNVGRRVAYLGKPAHILSAGAVLATGLMGSWVFNVLAMAGGFVVVWRSWVVVMISLVALVMSIMSSWLMFRLLVWKATEEWLRPLCSLFVATTVWVVDFVGNMCAIRYEELDGREPSGDITISFEGREDGGGLLLILLALWALWTQYAIALELRLAYCGLQDANFDLLLLASSPGVEDASRRSSARGQQTAPIGSRRLTNNAPPRSPMQRRASMNTRVTPSPPPELPKVVETPENTTASPPMANANVKLGSNVRLGPLMPSLPSRSTKVEPVSGGQGGGEA